MRFYILMMALVLCVTSVIAEDKSLAVKAVAGSTELFSTKFYKAIAEGTKNKNLISSSLSAHIVLSMAAYGAGGNTAVQMRSTLDLPKEDTLSYEGFKSLIDELNNTKNVTLKVANKVYVASDLKMKSDFKKLTSGSFRSEAELFDVKQPVITAQKVNSWVDENTDHLIKDIIKDSDITGDVRMLLLNAVHFKGKWAKKFNVENTKNRAFHYIENDQVKQKDVPTMYIKNDFFYGELPDLKAKFIELPYENKNLKMVIIVPDEYDGLSNIEENLEAFNRSRLEQEGWKREVYLYLPKFKIESEIDLKSPLMKLGMVDMFSNAANFSGISDEMLKVGKAIQKAFIEVDEEGSKAAAVTGLSFVLMSAAPSFTIHFRVDRPFYFNIYDSENKLVLFQGKLSNLN